ncbi:hypothetical protein SLEP1_g28561 [Rubroshorea leprosula]|uniref:Peptidase A1 domain-containing protein n=1 Tax=Rubroshorea leprosula TaxID=152421 RepID=A0AAV5JU66_9ROSI|nr:hypothetical protein SLEP1_g28561 [Rubroshorea leprosula]
MKTLLAVPSLPLFILTIFVLSIPTTTVATPKPVAIKLIHRDSIHSPYHSPKANAIDRMERAVEVSISQLQRITTMDDAIQANILPSINSFMFLANLSIGQPPIPQFTIMDTGSSLLWVQCLPCPPSTGILAMEQVTFETSDEGIITVPNVVFGCGHNNGNFKDGRTSGVLGLGYKPVSLVSHLGSRFSYCISNLFDTTYSHNKLVLGSGAKLEGYSTPLEVINGHYYIDLQGISIGEKRLDIDPSIFKTKSKNRSGVIIDSGSPATWLVKEAYETLQSEVQNLLDVRLTKLLFEPWPLCYQGILSQDLIGFPAVTFHFAEGADLVLDIESLFFQRRQYEVCMSVFPSHAIRTDLSLVGIMAQQNYNIAYDIPGKKLYFQRIECELLDD